MVPGECHSDGAEGSHNSSECQRRRASHLSKGFHSVGATFGRATETERTISEGRPSASFNGSAMSDGRQGSAFLRSLAVHMANATPNRRPRMGRFVLYSFMFLILVFTIVHFLGGVK